MRKVLRAVAIRLLGSRAAVNFRLYRVASHSALTVLNFHRVDVDNSSAYEAMAPELFDWLVGWLKEHFRIVVFGDLQNLNPGGKPPLVLSFDDGYRDFVSNVMPVLAHHGVKANLNVIPGCVESGRPPMNVIIQDFIGQAPALLLREISFPGVPERVDPNDRVRYGQQVSSAFKCRPLAEQRLHFARLEHQFARLNEFRTTPMMTLDEVRLAAQVHEIGAHSFDHATMTAETDEFLCADLVRRRAWFHEHIGVPPAIYAFPNGAARSTHLELVRQSGFRHALLVGERFSSVAGFAQPRFTMYGSGRSEVRFRALGGITPPHPFGIDIGEDTHD